MKAILIITFLSIVFTNCTDSNISNTDQGVNSIVDTLIFSSRGFNSGHNLKLMSDNQFIDENLWASCFGGGGKRKVLGSYNTQNGKTVLTPKIIEFTESPMLGLDAVIETKTYKYNPDSLRIQAEYYLVNWRRNKYLLSETDFDMPEYESDFVRFARYFNSESRRFKFDGFLYIENENTCDSLNPKFDYNQIPIKWQSYFLKLPIAAKIEEIKLIEKEAKYGGGFYQIKLNKGTNDKVFQGLYMTNNMNDVYIDSVYQNKSYSTIYLNKNEKPYDLINSKVITKWE